MKLSDSASYSRRLRKESRFVARFCEVREMSDFGVSVFVCRCVYGTRHFATALTAAVESWMFIRYRGVGEGRASAFASCDTHTPSYIHTHMQGFSFW